MGNTIPWCFMPPETHFDSPEDLKEAIHLFQLSRLSKLELYNGRSGFIPPKGKFERIKVEKGKYILLPTAIDYAYLFRGQGEDYPRNLPTIYRQSKSELDMFIQRLKMVEFRLFLQQLPQVKYFDDRQFNVDYLGLAQHYGFQTEVMDLTSDIDVALFFAMCDLPKGQTEYNCKTEDRPYIGYLYCVPTHNFIMKSNRMIDVFWGSKITAIGLQPFERPGVQKGFAIHLNEGEDLKSLVYSFSYTREDSERIFRKFSNGKALWKDDAIAQVARRINESKLFSYNAFNACVKEYGEKRTDYRKLLRANGYTLCKQPCYAQSALQGELIKNFKEEQEYQQDIVSRKCKHTNGHVHQCLSLDSITSQMMLNLIESGCPAPEGYKNGDGIEMDQQRRIITLSTTIPDAKVQTHPDPATGKVSKWIGDWRKELRIDFGKDKMFEKRVVIT